MTPRGANEFHGSAFWAHRNDNLNANTFFNTTDGVRIVDDRGRASRVLGGIDTAGIYFRGNTARFTTRFGETSQIARLDGTGKLLSTGCIAANGNSANSRIAFNPNSGSIIKERKFFFNSFGNNIRIGSGAQVNTAGGFGDLISATATPFQPNNRGGLDTIILALDFSPRITAVMKTGKQLIVDGADFDEGAAILINGANQTTANDETNPVTRLIGKKAGKKIKSGDIVQVENSDGSRSNEFRF